ncbi:MAG: sulfite exporter TauE/SafE family protein [Gemmatimonadaceae bacterium]
MAFIGYALAALVGLSLGVMGGGGSILTVPIFVYVLGFDPKVAIAMSLPVVGATSLIGAISHWKEGNVKLRTAALFGVIAMAGAYAGARLSIFLSGSFQLVLLAIVMLMAAVSMFRSARRDNRRALDELPESRRVGFGLLIPVALAVGLLTGLVGIGGGFLVVPALVLLAGISMKQAVGTSLLVIAMNSLSGSIGYVGQVTMPWGLMLGFTAVAAAGILAGTRIVRFVSQPALKQGFAVFLLLMGAFILHKNRGSLHLAPATPEAAAEAPAN